MSVKRLTASTVLLMNKLRKKEDAEIIRKINNTNNGNLRCPNCDSYLSNCVCPGGPSKPITSIGGTSLNKTTYITDE